MRKESSAGLKLVGDRPISGAAAGRAGDPRPFMKSLLEFAPSAFPDSVLGRIKTGRLSGRSTGTGVRLVSRSGKHYDLPFASNTQPVAAGVSVYVWWGVTGPVCAPVAWVDADEARSSSITKQVERARARLAKARLDRPARHATPVDIQV